MKSQARQQGLRFLCLQLLWRGLRLAIGMNCFNDARVNKKM